MMRASCIHSGDFAALTRSAGEVRKPADLHPSPAPAFSTLDFSPFVCYWNLNVISASLLNGSRLKFAICEIDE